MFSQYKGLFRCLMPTVLGLSVLVTWWWPAPKPSAVAGRFDFVEFWLLAVLSAAFLSLLAISLARKSGRVLAFRVITVWLGVGVVVMSWEACAWWLPAAEINNPWFISAGVGLKGSEDVPYERPPHIRWEGSSIGDLALSVRMPDPYARTVTFYTDAEGFRNTQEVDRADIVFIGDSFTEAGNVPEEETFVRLVEQKVGMSARNLGAELVVLQKYGLKCRPRVVVWQIAELNDLKDAVAFREWQSVGRPYWEFPTEFSREAAWKSRSPSYRVFELLIDRKPTPSGTFTDSDGKPHLMLFAAKPGFDQQPRRHMGSRRQSIAVPTCSSKPTCVWSSC